MRCYSLEKIQVLGAFPVVNDSVHAAIGSGKPKPSPSDLRSRWRADRADQASTMTLVARRLGSGLGRANAKHRPDRVFRHDRGGPVRLVAGDAKRVENNSAGRERSSNPDRNMGSQIYGYCPMRLMETQFRCRIGQRRVDTRDGGMYRTRYHRHKAPLPAQIGR